MDQLVFASLSHTHYWYEVAQLEKSDYAERRASKSNSTLYKSNNRRRIPHSLPILDVCESFNLKNSINSRGQFFTYISNIDIRWPVHCRVKARNREKHADDCTEEKTCSTYTIPLKISIKRFEDAARVVVFPALDLCAGKADPLDSISYLSPSSIAPSSSLWSFFSFTLQFSQPPCLTLTSHPIQLAISGFGETFLTAIVGDTVFITLLLPPKGRQMFYL